MRFKTLTILNVSILLSLLLINCWIYINRNEGYAYQEISSYGQLYAYDEMERISSVYFDGKDSLKLTIKEKEDLSNVEKNLSRLDWNTAIKLKEGTNDYTIKNREGKKNENIEIRINFISEETFKKNGRTKNNDIEIFSSNTPIGDSKLYSLFDWKQESQYITSEDYNDAKKLLIDSVKICEGDNTIEKIQKIATYIIKKLDTCRGIPSDSMDFISPIKQIKFAELNKSKVWCGNFASIFSFLASNANLITRAVDLGSNYGGIQNPSPRHSFNEVFIPELKKWVFVDLTSKTIFMKSPSGELLNTIDFYTMHMLKSSQLTTVTVENDSLKEIQYYEIEPFYSNYFSPNSHFIFYFKDQFLESTYSLNSKLMRYFFKKPTFTIFSNTINNDNHKFYLKQFSIFALLTYVILWIFRRLIVHYTQ
jgi:hypothetical protein